MKLMIFVCYAVTGNPDDQEEEVQALIAINVDKITAVYPGSNDARTVIDLGPDEMYVVAGEFFNVSEELALAGAGVSWSSDAVSFSSARMKRLGGGTGDKSEEQPS